MDNEAIMMAMKEAMGGEFQPCEGCPHPDRCKALGYCAMDKAQKGFMGDKYADRKKGM